MTDKPASAGRNRAGQFLPGQSGNPKGRVRGSRNKLGEAFFNDLYAEWLEHGSEVIAKVREDQPAVFLKVVAGTLPKDLNVNVDRYEDVTDEELTQMILRLKDEIIRQEGGVVEDEDGDEADKGLH
jgi:hypothetical protein